MLISFPMSSVFQAFFVMSATQPLFRLRIAVPDRTHRGTAVSVRTVAAGGKRFLQDAPADGAKRFAKRRLDSLCPTPQTLDHIRGDRDTIQLAPEFRGSFPKRVVFVQRSEAGIAGLTVQPATGNQIFHAKINEYPMDNATSKMNLVLAMSKAQRDLLCFSILPRGGNPDKRNKQQKAYKNRAAKLPIRQPHI